MTDTDFRSPTFDPELPTRYPELYRLIDRPTELELELIEAVKAHALEHYNDGGWDVVVETFSDAELLEQIGKARTVAGALRKFAPLVDVWADRQADAVNSAF